ncbi:hypothetical protein [Ralstonia pseudosolanacearum]|uniref:hypothetical protein n=1 Tax=Ralstonia pseudosolanacearum TaxID=1310165 RepID=UPI002675465E|nr:hypothetical protein [Ralstonia pseudosolanacearum]MDO3535943.1 hypothetical protein [Ralstonia pseudosolanacearum]
MMPSATDKSATATARMEAYSQYRDMLIQYLFVSKAQRYLLQVENLERMSDQALRKRFKDRMQRLADRQAKLDAALVGLMSNPLIDHRNTRACSTRTSEYCAASIPAAPSRSVAGQPSGNSVALPLMAEAVDAHGDPHPADGGNDFTKATGEEGWLISSVPSTNINGLPMVGSVDIHGNPYGSTAFDGGNGF